MQRIVVGVDGSAAARKALAWAVDEARLRDARLLVLYTYDPPRDSRVVAPPGIHTYNPVALQVEAAESEERRNQQFEMEQARGEAIIHQTITDAGADLEGLTVTLRATPHSRPSQALVRASEGADLLVVGSRGRGGFAGLRLGSVSQQCLHHAHCPVAVIRADQPGSDTEAEAAG